MEVLTALAKLVNVKSLVTIALTIGFIVQSVRGELSNDYMSVYLVVISFYFGTQYQKKTTEADEAYRLSNDTVLPINHSDEDKH